MGYKIQSFWIYSSWNCKKTELFSEQFIRKYAFVFIKHLENK